VSPVKLVFSDCRPKTDSTSTETLTKQRPAFQKTQLRYFLGTNGQSSPTPPVHQENRSEYTPPTTEHRTDPYTERRPTAKPATIDTYAASRTGKSPEPYLHAALVNSADRKLISPQHKNPNTSQYPPLQSPYTRVYGKRKIFDASPSISKLKLTNTHTTLFRPNMSG
jgi:hypothetical protein